MSNRTRIALIVFSFAAAPATAAVDVPADAVLATLPFLEVDEPNRVYVDLAEEDAHRPFRLLLDTGAAHSVMTPLAARAAGVSVRAMKDTPYRRKTRVGRDVQFYVDTRTSDTGAKTGWEYGLLGGNFFESLVVELDFTGRSVRFIDAERWSAPAVASGPNEAVLAMRDNVRPIVEIEIDGQPLRVLLDTGCSVGLVISGKAAAKLGVDVAALKPFGVAATTLGPMEVRHWEASDVAIGGVHFRNVPVEVAPKGWYGMAGEANDSVIGYDLLSRFLVRIDYEHRRVQLERRSEQLTYLGVDYALTRETGAFLAPFGPVFRVQYVMQDSPAARLGLRPGDGIERRPETRTPQAALARIRDGLALPVMRGDANGARIDVLLEPEPPATP